ncbi:hypothetical protein K435DRAFT_812067 [Dendrothele bispora CBS 962.96]|uniref:ABC transporter domain-containing protein n=1 Tax=Dendrothele bispora (strain CBS 962.96) TaxID=1314807 RepID=A0A4S8KQ70_DENBC|nr:hypothetical protein K435DRAFT_812067 [Dendrothele bispora CBS 962.96]
MFYTQSAEKFPFYIFLFYRRTARDGFRETKPRFGIPSWKFMSYYFEKRATQMQLAARARIVSWDNSRVCSIEKVCIIHEGKCTYFGPTSETHQYFIDMGYEPANCQNTPGFLVAVADPNGHSPRSLASSPASSPSSQPPAPKIATGFVDYFNQSCYALPDRQDVNQYKDEMVGNQKLKDALGRRLQMLRGNWLATFLNVFFFGVIIYKLQQTVGQVFVFLLFIFSVALAMKGFFRALAAACKSESVAQTFADIVILALSMYAGYMIPRPSMIGALRWISYINPFRYGFEPVMTNEFRTLNGTCDSLIPSGPGYENVTLINQNLVIPTSMERDSLRCPMSIVILIPGGTSVSSSLPPSDSSLSVCSSLNSTPATSAVLFLRSKAKNALRPKPSSSSDKEKGSAIAVVEEVSREKETEAKATKELAKDSATMDVFSWQSICYTVPVKDGERRLLNNVSGFVAPGKLTALMGESGAGKSTLNVVAQRVSTGVVTGDKFVNGQPLPWDFQLQTSNENSGYCQQTDTHLGDQTVREALLFSAKLRQPMSVPIAEKEAYMFHAGFVLKSVDQCLETCGLEAFRDATVGSLNVENRKRTTIGVELAAKLKLLLLLDEPTSGLDSQSAWAIIAFLRDLVNNGQAILCTIHQSSAELFQVFDCLILLRKGGETVYCGDLGHNATTLIDYFKRDGSRHCQPEENPAEFMLDVIGIDWYSVASQEVTALETQIERIHGEGREKKIVESTQHSEFATPWILQLWELLKRDMQSHYRNPTYLTSNRFSFFMSTSIISVPLANQLQVIYINMRNMYEIREHPSRMYSWTALVASLIEIPWNIIDSSLFFFCWYWTVGYPSSRAGYTYLMMGMIFPVYYTIGQAVASMSPNAEIAALLFSFIFSFVIAFNSVVQPFRQLGWWKWM